jgi:hypothetical protein
MAPEPSLAHRLGAHVQRLADRLFGDAAGRDGETAGGEFTSAFISEKSLVADLARQDGRRKVRRSPRG